MANAPPPWEYIELLLCREFSALPSQVRRENVGDMLRVLKMIEMEQKARKNQAKMQHG